MDRQLVAYLIVAVLVAGIVAIVAFRRYHSFERSYRRRCRKENEDYERMMAERAGSPE